MSLVTVAEVRALVQTSLIDAQLQAVIDRVEAEITAVIGAPQNDEGTVEITKQLQGGTQNIYLPVEIGQVVSIHEDGVLLIADEYRVWPGAVIERLPGGMWGRYVVVVFKPVDARPQRKSVTIDLVRLDVNRTAMQSENVAGEYSYQAPVNWDAERRKVMKRLAFAVAG